MMAVVQTIIWINTGWRVLMEWRFEASAWKETEHKLSTGKVCDSAFYILHAQTSNEQYSKYIASF